MEDERLRFIARLLDGEKMTTLCAEFGISRKTGYKIYDRYKDCGVEALTDRSRRPYRHANQLPMVVEKLIVALKREYPGWGGAEDTGAAPTAVVRRALPRDQHRPRRARSPRPSTWQYRLLDRSTGNIRALMNDRSVDDTGYIDRRTFTTTDGRQYLFLWWPLHQSLWLLLAGGLLLAAAGATLPVRRLSTIVALAVEGRRSPYRRGAPSAGLGPPRLSGTK